MNKKWNTLRNLIGLMLLSIVIGSCFFTYVNQTVYNIVPRQTITITVEKRKQHSTGGNEVWLAQRSPDQRNVLFKVSGDNGIWEYRDAQIYGYSANMLVSYGDNVGSTISFDCPKLANSEILFWKNANGGIISIDTNNTSSRVDLYSDAAGGEYYSIFPFPEEKLGFMLKCVAYILLFGAIFGVLCLLFKLFYNGVKLPAWMERSIDWKIFLAFFIVLYGFAVIQYQIGIPNYLAFGDQEYYWRITNFFTDGQWNMEQFANNTVCFRGYLCNFIPFISKTLGALVKIDPVYVYFIFTTASASFLTGFVMPKLHELLTGQKTKIYQTVIFLLIFVAFWNGMLTAVLMDLFAVTCFMAGLMYVLWYAKRRKPYHAILGGVFLAGAAIFRSAYKIGIIALIAIVLAVLVLKVFRIIRKKSKPVEDRWYNKISIKRIIVGIILFAVSFVAVCIPQIQINAERGHADLLPYDTKGSWVEGTTLAEFSANFSLTSSLIVYPYGVTDKQVTSMKNSYYGGDKLLSMNQLFDMFVSNPADTTVYIGKKIFLGFDTKTNVTYPVGNYVKKSSHYIFSLFNYIVLACGLFALFFIKINKKEKIIFALMFLTLILPQTLVHVEWRYYISGYLIFYYLFAYRFVRLIEDKELFRKAAERNILFYLAGFIYLSQWISMNFYG